MSNKHTSARFLKNYSPPSSNLWTGRATSRQVGNQYWHQHIELFNLSQLSGIKSRNSVLKVGLLGYATDEGVRRNSGRIGASDGPAAFRKQLSKLSFHHENKRVYDCGDIACNQGQLELAQDDIACLVQYLVQNSIFPILVGGGHDIAFGHYKGIYQNLKQLGNPKIGIVNFDAHFDIRPIETEANSGTPFNQILHEFGASANYFVLGIQKEANTKELFDIAKKKKVNYLLNYECDNANLEYVKQQLTPLLNKCDCLYVTIDMDGFSSAYAPGVSAPSPLGFTPYFVLNIFKFLLKSKKVISCDIVELNPKYDRDDATANLVARIVDFIVGNLPQNNLA